MAQLRQVGVIQTGPVLREGLGTVPLDLPARKSADRGDSRDPIPAPSWNSVALQGVWQIPEAAQNQARSRLQLQACSNLSLIKIITGIALSQQLSG